MGRRWCRRGAICEVSGRMWHHDTMAIQSKLSERSDTDQPMLFAMPAAFNQSRRRAALPAALVQALQLVPDRNPNISTRHEPSGRPPQFVDPPCSTIGVELYYSEGPDGVSPSKVRTQTCAECPFQASCMTWALESEPHGIWALTAGERAALGGVAFRPSKRTAESAVRAAMRDGIDPDNIAMALRAVHGRNATRQAPGVDRTSRTDAA